MADRGLCARSRLNRNNGSGPIARRSADSPVRANVCSNLATPASRVIGVGRPARAGSFNSSTRASFAV